MSNQPDPCHFCGHPPCLEVCDDLQCGCGFRYLSCLNDECPVQPSIDRSDVETAEEAVAIWNGERAIARAIIRAASCNIERGDRTENTKETMFRIKDWRP